MSFRVVLLALALMAAAAAVAGAADERPNAFAREEAGDVDGGLDLVRVALAVGADGRLRGELTMSAAWTATSLRGSGGGPPPSACLRLYTKRDPTADVADYLVCAFPSATSETGYTARVLRERRNAPPKKVARAVASRPTTRTLYLRFPPKAIGDPARLRFGGEVTVPAPQCSPSLGCRDVAPDGSKTVVLRLRPTSQDR
jgi:hypothetical protein